MLEKRKAVELKSVIAIMLGISVDLGDKAGVDESVQKAKDWIAKNAASTGVAAPKVSEGSVITQLN